MNRETLKKLTDAELILMQNDLRKFPNDKDSLHDVMKELGRRERKKMKTKVDKVRLRINAKLMLNSFDEMYKHLKENNDNDGKRILGFIMVSAGQFVEDLFGLNEEAIALIEEAKIKREADKEDLKSDLRADFEEMLTHLIDNEDQEGFETFVRIKKGANALIENLIRKEEDVFERWKIN